MRMLDLFVNLADFKFVKQLIKSIHFLRVYANFSINCFVQVLFSSDLLNFYLTMDLFFSHLLGSFQRTIKFIKNLRQNICTLFIYFDDMRILSSFLKSKFENYSINFEFGVIDFLFQQILFIDCS